MYQVGFILVAFLVAAAWAGGTEKEGKDYINEVYKNSGIIAQELSAKQFAADSATKADSDKAGKELDAANKKYDAYQKQTYDKIMSFPWKEFKDPFVKRMFFIESFVQEAGLPDDKKAQLEKVQQGINNVNDTAQIREYKSNDNKPKLKYLDVSKKLEKDRSNADEMNFYWKEWHDTVGKQVKSLFTQWVELETEVAKVNRFKNVAEFWQAQYEIDNFENFMLQLYKQIEPLYKELHAYIRHKLWVLYGKNNKIVDPKGPIPASLLGPRWGVDAVSLYSMLIPYPNKPSLDFSPALKAQKYTGKKMAETAENFFVSLGLSKLPPDVWSHSIFEKKGDMGCGPQVYDMANGQDYRILLCPDPASPSADDFVQMHDFVGYIEYVFAAKNLPYFFVGPPGNEFTMAYDNNMQEFARSPNYLKSLGLLDSKIQLDKELEINALLRAALEHVFFLPFGLAFDQWRWHVTEGKIPPQHYNCEYWKLVTNLQGIEPPVDRDESVLDAGIHAAAASGSTQFISYYIAEFMKYEIKRGLCKLAGSKTAPVFCDINKNQAVGGKLKEIMPLGNSQPWYSILEKLTGQKTLDASALLEYYQPLLDWLKDYNKKNQVTPGWTAGHNRCH